MPKPVVITAESTCDLPISLREEFGVHTIPLYVTLEGKTGQDCVDIFPEEIFEAFWARGSLAKTAAASIADYRDFFEQFTSKGCAVVHIALASVYSSSSHVASLAAQELPGEEIYIVDSKQFCTAQGMVCILAARLRDEGCSAAEIADRVANDICPRMRTIYYLDGLDFAGKSGRAHPAVVMAASMFNIHPSIAIDPATGEMVVGKKYRGKSGPEHWLRDSCARFLETCDPALCFFMYTPEQKPEQYEPLQALARTLLKDVRRLETDTVGCLAVAHCGGGCLTVVGLAKA